MRYKFVNAQNEEYTLSDSFKEVVEAYKRRVNLEERYNRDGGEVTGDRKVSPRTIRFSFDVVEQSDTEYVKIMNDIIGVFQEEKHPVYLHDIGGDRRTRVELQEIAERPSRQGLEKRIGQGDLVLTMSESYWENITESLVDSDSNGLSSGEKLGITNNSSVVGYPIITVMPFESNSEFTLKNEQTGALLTIGNGGFTVGTHIVIDSVEGTIKLFDGDDVTEISASLANGSGFIILLPGLNEITYTSAFGSIDLEIKFRERQAF